jgi:hypothetical protein
VITGGIDNSAVLRVRTARRVGSATAENAPGDPSLHLHEQGTRHADHAKLRTRPRERRFSHTKDSVWFGDLAGDDSAQKTVVDATQMREVAQSKHRRQCGMDRNRPAPGFYRIPKYVGINAALSPL